MAKQGKKSEAGQKPMSGMERLGLRVSSMINHPIAQLDRSVTIHRLDTDGQREWDELLTILSDTDGIDMTINDEDESITLEWEAASDEDRAVEADDVELAEPLPPF
ncbi:DUF1654 domain-containing protein [Pseudomonas atacamensis]|uniref:DUF1654 domain-containing protein n=1 Tax=Pseudomonas atacamensis TaxID=2565368 RepID=UPI001F3FD779|nr:DUF1654 domain-containing protein [Pseudomonas atacamensis]